MNYVELTLNNVEKILEYQHNYFNTNVTKDINFRIKQLKLLKKGLKKYEKEIIKALYADLGKSKSESYISEIGIVYKSISYAIKNLGKWAKPEKKHTPIYLFPGKSYVVSEPYGTVLILGAFNYPVQLVLEPLIGAIAAGNTAVIKTSELAINTSCIIRKMIQDTFSKRYIVCVEGGIETAKVLINSKFDYIFFTGSTTVGKIVMEAAAKNLVPVTLELGGKSPVIVGKDANLKEAARRIIWGKTLNAGQTCIAPDYVMVHKSVENALIKQMAIAIRKYYGNDIEKSDGFGRIINQKQFDRLVSLIETSKENVVFGGTNDAEDKYIEPTIIKVDSWNNPLMQEEIFGPILPILNYEDLNEAIKDVKLQSKPLALYVFTKNKKVKQQLIREISSGNVCVNDTILHTANNRLPFGGVGNSGIGAYHGYDSFVTFSHKKGILEKNPNITNTIIYPPFNSNKLKIIKRFLK